MILYELIIQLRSQILDIEEVKVSTEKRKFRDVIGPSFKDRSLKLHQPGVKLPKGHLGFPRYKQFNIQVLWIEGIVFEMMEFNWYSENYKKLCRPPYI